MSAIPKVPPLQPGDRLTRAEFERRYAAMPHVKKAELLEGVVYMPSPVSEDFHAAPHFDVIAGWVCTASPHPASSAVTTARCGLISTTSRNPMPTCASCTATAASRG